MSSPCFGKPHMLLDVSNHGVLFLPMQRIAYRPLNSSEFINIVVGPSNLKSFTDGPEQQQKWKARDAGDADIDEKQNERDGTFCAASIMDMEPIPFTTAMPLDQTPYNGSMFGVPCVASNSSPVSLGEKMQNVRRCSLSSLFSMYNAETDSFDCFCSREKSAASHPLEFQNKEQYQPCQQSGEDAALSTTLDGIKICKPLSCYNYFYRDERDNIVNGIGNPGDPLPEPVHDFSDAKRSLLLKHHWTVDPTKSKRQHRKRHGKIAFSTLSREIARRWKILPSSGRAFYHGLAKADLDHYNRNLAAATRSRTYSTSFPSQKFPPNIGNDTIPS